MKNGRYATPRKRTSLKPSPQLTGAEDWTVRGHVGHRNHEGAAAYAYRDEHKLAQLAMTGCLNPGFYSDGESQFSAVRALVSRLDPLFVVQTAVYARKVGYMKDMPLLIAACLSTVNPTWFEVLFSQVVDNGKALRRFVGFMRSGVAGRRSLGSRPKGLVQKWLLQASENALLHASVGTAPSLADMVKMVHPKPTEPWRAAWFAWLLGRPYDVSELPPLTRAFEEFKRLRRLGQDADVPDVPFQMLTGLPLRTEDWSRIAVTGSWQMVRQGLNTFARHGALDDGKTVGLVSRKLTDAALMRRARVMPYQVMVTAFNLDERVPESVRRALEACLDVALDLVPRFLGHMFVCPDLSWSMQSPVTGYRASASTRVRCIDVATLVASAVVRKNPEACVLPFKRDVVEVKVNPRATVLENASRLASLGGGGTNCSAPLAWINERKLPVDWVVMISDNESWVDARDGRDTETMIQWGLLKSRNPHARLLCIDLQPDGSTQAPERDDIMNVGGFSDEVFRLMADFAEGTTTRDHWVREIERVELI